MTYDAMLQAFENRETGEAYQALSDAAYSRSQADWIIGMNGSRIATRLPQNRDRSANSLGRVQTATLAMVVDHELEVLSHVPVPYWQLNATFTAGDAVGSVDGSAPATKMIQIARVQGTPNHGRDRKGIH